MEIYLNRGDFMRGYQKGQKLRSKTNADYVVEIQFKRIENGKTFYFTKSDANKNCVPYNKKELDEQFELIESR